MPAERDVARRGQLCSYSSTSKAPEVLYSQEQKELGQSHGQVARPRQDKRIGPGPVWASVSAGPRTSPYLSDEVWIWALEPFACQRWKKSSAMRENQLNYYISKHLLKNLPPLTI